MHVQAHATLHVHPARIVPGPALATPAAPVPANMCPASRGGDNERVRMLGRFRPRHTCECRDCGSQSGTGRWRRRVEQRETRDEIEAQIEEGRPQPERRTP